MKFGLRRVHAFSLVELTLALGVAAFCLIGVFGLMPLGVQANRNATSQSLAANIMAAVVADLRAASKPYDNSTTYLAGAQVVSGSDCYVAIAPSTTGHPPPNPTYWGAGSACPRFGISFGTNAILYFDGSGQFTTSLDANSRYQLSATWYNDSVSTGLKYADLKVTWPASADPSTPSGSAEMFAAFDRN